jgi:hypothetical protein
MSVDIATLGRCVECATAHGVRPDELPENTDA